MPTAWFKRSILWGAVLSGTLVLSGCHLHHRGHGYGYYDSGHRGSYYRGGHYRGGYYRGGSRYYDDDDDRRYYRRGHRRHRGDDRRHGGNWRSRQGDGGRSGDWREVY